MSSTTEGGAGRAGPGRRRRPCRCGRGEGLGGAGSVAPWAAVGGRVVGCSAGPSSRRVGRSARAAVAGPSHGVLGRRGAALLRDGQGSHGRAAPRGAGAASPGRAAPRGAGAAPPGRAASPGARCIPGRAASPGRAAPPGRVAPGRRWAGPGGQRRSLWWAGGGCRGVSFVVRRCRPGPAAAGRGGAGLWLSRRGRMGYRGMFLRVTFSARPRGAARTGVSLMR